MAEGWARQLHGGVLDPASAGIETHGLNPNAVAVMKESGVDISGHRSQTLADFADAEGNPPRWDLVVTVCGHADETCPALPGVTRKVHVGFDDPPKLAQGETDPERALDHYRRVRDEIRTFVETLPVLLAEG
tara:strand:+ start:735 stop:1130 length:396 start_codon:yes stop_codon:yes gene_type:complete